MKGFLVSLALLLALTAVAGQPAVPLQVFLVRHAEKTDASTDPPLSAAGQQRARDLAHSLGDAGIEYLHSSDYLRTRDTAAPLARQLGLAVAVYDVEALPALADTLRQRGGRHLVVGHSDTTPELVSLLGGAPGSDIDEASEYDRLYLVAIDASGNVSTTLLRYGAAFTENRP